MAKYNQYKSSRKNMSKKIQKQRSVKYDDSIDSHDNQNIDEYYTYHTNKIIMYLSSEKINFDYVMYMISQLEEYYKISIIPIFDSEGNFLELHVEKYKIEKEEEDLNLTKFGEEYKEEQTDDNYSEISLSAYYEMIWDRRDCEDMI